MNKINTSKELQGIILLAGVMAFIFIAMLLGVKNASASIDRQLDLGDSNGEVSELQTYMSSDANIYPSKLVTGYFGQLTKAGVERFQTTNGIVSNGTPATTGYGRVGPITQASINARLAGGMNTSGDVYAPIIKVVSVSTGDTSAAVNWTASESSYGKVYYSTTPIRISNTFDITGVFSGEPTVSGTLAEYDGQSRVSHTVNIDNLASNTRYYYLVVVYDAAKNVSFTLPASFRTK